MFSASPLLPDLNRRPKQKTQKKKFYVVVPLLKTRKKIIRFCLVSLCLAHLYVVCPEPNLKNEIGSNCINKRDTGLIIV